MPKPHRYHVLIVGLGPVGAVLAVLCAKLGLRVRAVEQDREIYRLPRAVHIDYEVLRLLNFVDVADDVLEHSCASTGYEFKNRDHEILMSRYPPPGLAPTGYPWANMFHQPSLESALRARLRELPDVQLSLGATVTDIGQDSEGVHAVVETDHGTERIDAAWAVGCDGGRSFVRRALDIDMVDLGFEEPWVVVDVKLPSGMRQLAEVSVQLCDPAQPTTSVLSGPGRHRWEFMLRPGDDHAAATDPETLKARLSAWVDPETVELERSAVYEFHGLIARRWRDGHIVLVGDAAHQMPPFFGQGLCSGVRDACNLAWKLAAVLRGDAAPSFLDTVQGEREPHVAGITRSAIELGRVVCVADEDEAAERDRNMLAGKAPFPSMPVITSGVLGGKVAGRPMPEPMVAGTNRRVDDVVGYVPLLVVADGHAAAGDAHRFQQRFAGARVGSLANARDGQVALQDASGVLRKALGDAEALLAKPDRIVFGAGGVASLADAWSAYLGDGARWQGR